jgi:hypothetical protein
MSNKQKALTQLDKIEKQLADLLSSMEKEKTVDLLYHEKEADWSSLQVLKHIELVEAISLKYIKYKVKQGSKFKKAGLKQVYASWIMQKAYKSSKKFTAPEGRGLVPEREGLDYVEIVKSFKQHRVALKQFLTELNEKYYNYAVYKHPLFGRLTLLQMLTFFYGHMERHEKQINRTLVKAKESLV